MPLGGCQSTNVVQIQNKHWLNKQCTFTKKRKCKHCNKLHSNSVCSPDMKTPGSYDRRIVPSIIRGRIIGRVLVLCCKTASTYNRHCKLPQRAAHANDASFQAGIFRRVKLAGFVLRVEFEGLGTRSNRGDLTQAGSWLPGLN